MKVKLEKNVEIFLNIVVECLALGVIGEEMFSRLFSKADVADKDVSKHYSYL